MNLLKTLKVKSYFNLLALSLLSSCSGSKMGTTLLSPVTSNSSSGDSLSPDKLTVTHDNEVVAGTCAPIVIKPLDKNDASFQLQKNVTVKLSLTGNGKTYSDAECSDDTTELTLNKGSKETTLYFKNTSATNTTNIIIENQLYSSTDVILSPINITILSIPGPLSIEKSLTTASANTVQSGSSVTITFTAKDQYENSLSKGGDTIAFSHTSGTSTGQFSSVTDAGNGTYTATFTGQIAGTATTIQTTANSQLVNTAEAQITVTPGTFSEEKSTVVVANNTVASGSSTSITFTAKDQNENLITSGLAVTFSHSGGGSSGAISTVSADGNGTYTATFTGQIAGTATTIQTTVNGQAFTQNLPQVSVIPGPPSLEKSLLSVSSNTVAAGAQITVTLLVKDQFENNVSNSTPVAFSYSGGTSTGSLGSVSNAGNGNYSAAFQGLIAGTPTTILASINSQPITSTLPEVTVTPGALSLSKSITTVSAESVAAGSQVTITLTTRDAYDNILTSGGASVSFSLTGGSSTGSIGNVVDLNNGTYTSTFLGQKAGSASKIKTLVNSQALTSLFPKVTVIPGPPSPDKTTITVSANTVSAGSNVIITLTAKDHYDNPIKNDVEFAFAHQGGTSTGDISNASHTGGGIYTANFSGRVAGTATNIVTTANTQVLNISKPQIVVTPGALSLKKSITTVSAETVTAGNEITVTLTTKDLYENTISNGGAAVSFTNSGGSSTGIFASVTDQGNGLYTTTFQGRKSGSPTKIYTTIDAQAVTSTLPQVTVIPGAASPEKSITVASSDTVKAGNSITLTLTTKDSYDNLLTAGGASVSFNYSGGTSTGAFGSVNDLGNGKYTSIFEGKRSGTATKIVTTMNSQNLTSLQPEITVNVGNASSLRIETLADGSGSEVLSKHFTNAAQLQLFAIRRDIEGNFIDNTTASWSLNTSDYGYLTDNNGTTTTFIANKGGTPANTPHTITAVHNALSDTTGDIEIEYAPQQISNLVRWFKADSFMPKASGTLVGNPAKFPWLDLNNSVTPYSGNEATNRRMPVFNISSLYFCRDDVGSNCPRSGRRADRLRISEDLSASNWPIVKNDQSVDSHTVFAVVARGFANTGSNPILSINTVANSGLHMGWSSDTNFLYSINGEAGSSALNVSVPGYPGTSTYELWTAVYNRNSGNPSTLTLYKNGSVAASNNQIPTTVISDTSPAQFIGNGYTNMSGRYYIGEIVIYNKALNSTELCSVQNYLKSKFSLNDTPTCP